jgi:hypothetical protein
MQLVRYHIFLKFICHGSISIKAKLWKFIWVGINVFGVQGLYIMVWIGKYICNILILERYTIWIWIYHVNVILTTSMHNDSVAPNWNNLDWTLWSSYIQLEKKNKHLKYQI